LQPVSDQERTQNLRAIFNHLNTPQGTQLVDELEEAWDVHTLLGGTPEQTAYNVGLRDAYRFVRDLQDGAFLEEGPEEYDEPD
jgi:hypothetical protein